MRDRRLADRDRLGRAGHAAVLDDGEEESETIEIERQRREIHG
jgi:hypothetical protein